MVLSVHRDRVIGASPLKKDKAGRLPIDYARDKGFVNIVRSLDDAMQAIGPDSSRQNSMVGLPFALCNATILHRVSG